MPPKRKAPAKTQAAVKGKKVKKEPEPEEDSFRSTVEALKAAPKEKLKAKIDAACQLCNTSGAKVRLKPWQKCYLYPACPSHSRGKRALTFFPGTEGCHVKGNS
ncbi:UNVERIFIED_CONTAM: hypothetical protein K2H54_043708 [Gekko kuhli]